MDSAGFEPAASLSQPKGLRPFRNPGTLRVHMKGKMTIKQTIFSYNVLSTKNRNGLGGI